MSDKTIVITMGDPTGIGPEVICKALSRELVRRHHQFVIVGASSVFDKIPTFKKIKTKRNVNFVEVKPSAFSALKTAVKLIKCGQAQALVTAPISKAHMFRSGFKFPGHTEYLCQEFSVKKYGMMLFHHKLRVTLTTIHVPLKKIFSKIDQQSILEKLELTSLCLRQHFQIKRPKIAVCGLNPHAGENGLLGREEREIILPAIKRFQKRKNFKDIQITGPVSADAVFHQALSGAYDAVLCHYHDQGLIPLKTTGFDEGVNLTLGLPFVRTSPDHGVAFDIAGRDVANPGSMVAAIEAAKRFI